VHRVCEYNDNETLHKTVHCCKHTKVERILKRPLETDKEQ